MKTPIADFCRDYAQSNTTRLHMPGHKGEGPLGMEHLDLTEIKGADSLYEAEGIIAESEANASQLFGSRKTFYSAGGSSQSIKAMCLLACQHWSAEQEGTPLFLAGRNAHKSFVQAAQLIGFDVEWMASEEDYSLCRCAISPDGLEMQLERVMSEGRRVAAVFVTSPDYLGNVLDIHGLAEVAHRYGTMLLVDNAHGAYLKFLPEDRHPMTLGADACADSAHKTLPVLTGGGYLHIGTGAPEGFEHGVRDAMCLFGSTSPSYLILQSLDLANDWLEKNAPAAFSKTVERVSAIKTILSHEGLSLTGEEPLKLTIDCVASQVGSGLVFADRLRDFGIECEYADRDVVVLMFAPNNTDDDYQKLSIAVHMLMQVQKHMPASDAPRPSFSNRLPERVLAPRDILLRPTETVTVSDAEGRIAADVHIGCPPAVLPVVPGERVDRNAVAVMEYYGIQTISVLK
ncbi:MAG: amino acid decarboxylase [Clostridia bacterium]|nr:amino acid decarboxylase [Clostridia bacterium]MBQ8926528.1 amino acid decarboxylase [Clostridia bacterium]